MATNDVEVRVVLRDEVTVPLKKVESGIIRFVGAITASIAAIKAIAFPLKSAAEFERAMLDVAKTTGFTGASFDKLGADLLDLSKVINVTAVDLAEIAAIAGQLGLGDQGTEGIAKFTETTARFSAVLDVAVGTAAEGLAKISNIFQISLTDAERIASAFNEVSNTSTASGQALLDVVKRLGNANKTINLSESIGLAATGVDFGLTLETIGTSFTKIFANMQARADQFADFMGVSTKEWANKVQNDGIGAWKQYLETLQNVDSAQRAFTIRQLSGGGRIFSLVSKSVADSANGYAILDKNIGNGTDAFNSGTSAMEEHARVLDGLIPRLQILGNTLTAIGTESGTAALPFLKGLTQQLQDAFTDPAIVDSIDQFAKSIGGALIVIVDMVKAIGNLDINWKNLITIIEYWVGLKIVQLLAGIAAHLITSAVHVGRLGASWVSLAANIETATVAKLKFIATGAKKAGKGEVGPTASVTPSTNLAGFLAGISFTQAGRAANLAKKTEAALAKANAGILENRSAFVRKALRIENKYAAALQNKLATQIETERRAARAIFAAKLSASQGYASNDAIPVAVALKRDNKIGGIEKTLASNLAKITAQQNALAVSATLAQTNMQKLSLVFKSIPGLLANIGKGLVRFLLGPFGLLSIFILQAVGAFGVIGDAFNDLLGWLGLSSKASQDEAKQIRLANIEREKEEKAVRASAAAYLDLVEAKKALVGRTGGVAAASSIGSVVDNFTPEETNSLFGDTITELQKVQDVYKKFSSDAADAAKETNRLNAQIIAQKDRARELKDELSDLNKPVYGVRRDQIDTRPEAVDRRKEIAEEIAASTASAEALKVRAKAAKELEIALRGAAVGTAGANEELNKTLIGLELSKDTSIQVFAQTQSQTVNAVAPLLAAIKELEILKAANEKAQAGLQTSVNALDSETPEGATFSDEKVKQLAKLKDELSGLTIQQTKYNLSLKGTRKDYEELTKDYTAKQKFDVNFIEAAFGKQEDVVGVALTLEKAVSASDKLGISSDLAADRMIDLAQAMFESNSKAKELVTSFERIAANAQESANKAKTAFNGVSRELSKLQESIDESGAASQRLFGERDGAIAFDRDIQRINDNYDNSIDRLTKIKERVLDRMRAEGVYYGTIEAKERELTRRVELENRQRDDAITKKNAFKVEQDVEKELGNIVGATKELKDLEKQLSSAVAAGEDYQAQVLRNRIESQVEIVTGAQDSLSKLIERMSGNEFVTGPEYLEQFFFSEKDVKEKLDKEQKAIEAAGSAIFDIRESDSEQATKRATEVTRVYETMESVVRNAEESVAQLSKSFELTGEAIAAMQGEVDTLGISFGALAKSINSVPTLSLGSIDVDGVSKEFAGAMEAGLRTISNDKAAYSALLDNIAASAVEAVDDANKKFTPATPPIDKVNTRNVTIEELRQVNGAGDSSVDLSVDNVNVKPKKVTFLGVGPDGELSISDTVQVNTKIVYPPEEVSKAEGKKLEPIEQPIEYTADVEAAKEEGDKARLAFTDGNYTTEEAVLLFDIEAKTGAKVADAIIDDTQKDVDRAPKVKIPAVYEVTEDGVPSFSRTPPVKLKATATVDEVSMSDVLKGDVLAGLPEEDKTGNIILSADAAEDALENEKISLDGKIAEVTLPEEPTVVPASIDGPLAQTGLAAEVATWDAAAIKVPVTMVAKNTIVDTGGVLDKIPAAATGGHIRGAGTGTSDSILSWLSNGEFVVKADAVRKYGANMLHMINSMRMPKRMMSPLQELPKFAMGGLASFSLPDMKLGLPAFAKGGDVTYNASNMESLIQNAANSRADASNPHVERVELALSIGGERYTVDGSRDQVKGLVNALKDVSRSVRRS